MSEAQKPTSAKRADEPKLPPTVIEIIAQEEKSDKASGRVAVVLAAIFHIVIFAITWPSFAGAAKDAQQTKAKNRLHGDESLTIMDWGMVHCTNLIYTLIKRL